MEAAGKEDASGAKGQSKKEPRGGGKRLEQVFLHLKGKSALKHLETILDRYIWRSTNSQIEHVDA